MLAQVIVDIVHENVAHVFSYSIPEGMSLQAGQRVAVPFGARRREGIVTGFSETADVPPEKLRSILEPLEDYPAVLPALLKLAVQMADEVHCPLAETLRLMLPAEMRGGRVRIQTQQTARVLVTGPALEQAIAEEKRSPRRRTLLQLLRDGGFHPVPELKLLVKDPLEPLRQLEQKGLVELKTEEILRAPAGSAFAGKTEDPPLTPLQKEAISEILPGLETGNGKFLLHGVTGSGKTEVFIRLVRKALEMGKTAIILVPEIALTPQMVSWFRARFGEVAAVLHSRLSAGERFDEWRRIRRGDARVVIGARSAVFAPLEHLGLIVVDEEHETTYISDHSPRYDARRIAELRCENENAVLLLASATPSILSFAKARRGDYVLLEMPQRVHDRPLPTVEIADMRRELELGNRSVFSGRLQAALAECIRQGEQAMLMMNRRGYHSFVSCRSCGYVMKCPNCDVSLTYHLTENDGRLHCHYCGYAAEKPETCPSCGSRYIRYFGAGTQKVEEELLQLFPQVSAVRMDADTTSGKDGHRRLLDRFRSGQAQVLIGTQMIAKGLDFPRVTLVGVIAADQTLNLPDFRSRERSFQLLPQVAGRAGRGSAPGLVIIQTYKPEDPVILQAAKQDYRAFFEEEFERRRRGLYPPFTVMARLLVEADSELDARTCAAGLYAECQMLLAEHPAWKKRTIQMLLDQPPVRMLRGKTRWHVLFRLLVHPDTEAFAAALTALAAKPREHTQVWFEYNPVNMM